MDKYRQAIIDLDREEPHDRPKDLELLNEVIKQCENQEKILDILKKKCVIQLFTDEPWEQLEYKMLVGGNLVIDLTKEEYDLLKEWLEK